MNANSTVLIGDFIIIVVQYANCTFEICRIVHAGLCVYVSLHPYIRNKDSNDAKLGRT